MNANSATKISGSDSNESEEPFFVSAVQRVEVPIYISIPHLPGSRMIGQSDRTAEQWQTRVCCEQTRDTHDLVVVQEKLDGSCVAIMKANGRLIPTLRSGSEAVSSRYEQHRHFHNWVFQNAARFGGLLSEGEWCVGEWLMQAHGTRYRLPHEPFVMFDLFSEGIPFAHSIVAERATRHEFITPRLLHTGRSIAVRTILKRLEPSAHGAIDQVEGAVWRVEREGRVQFRAKYVRPDKAVGCYLPEQAGQHPVWNWQPA